MMAAFVNEIVTKMKITVTEGEGIFFVCSKKFNSSILLFTASWGSDGRLSSPCLTIQVNVLVLPTGYNGECDADDRKALSKVLKGRACHGSVQKPRK
jgi:hypothetical protein